MICLELNVEITTIASVINLVSSHGCFSDRLRTANNGTTVSFGAPVIDKLASMFTTSSRFQDHRSNSIVVEKDAVISLDHKDASCGGGGGGSASGNDSACSDTNKPLLNSEPTSTSAL